MSYTFPPTRFVPPMFHGRPDGESIVVFYRLNAAESERIAEVAKPRAEKETKLAKIDALKSRLSRLESVAVKSDRTDEAIEQLNEALAELGEAPELEPIYDFAARLIGDVIVHLKIGGTQISWPSDFGARVALLREFAPLALLQVIHGISQNQFDAGVVGKS